MVWLQLLGTGQQVYVTQVSGGSLLFAALQAASWHSSRRLRLGTSRPGTCGVHAHVLVLACAAPNARLKHMRM